MKFGYFDDARREYAITTPATPLPWINYLGSEAFFGILSNTGGGYSFYRDAKLQRLTRFRYNGAADEGGRFFYIKEAGKAPWSPAFLPCRTPLDRYLCRHGLGYTVFESEKDGLGAEMTFFVPMGEDCEIQHVVLKNRTAFAKRVKFYAAVEWCLYNAVDDQQNFQRNLNIGEVERDGRALYHVTEYRERRDHYAYYGASAPSDGFDTDRDAFLGRFGAFSLPEQVAKEESGQSVASGWAPIACHRFDIELPPGGERRLTLVLGCARNPRGEKFEAPGVARKDVARRVVGKYSEDAAVARALCELRAHWDGLLGRFSIASADERLDRMVNIWNQYQLMTTFNISRSASYFESGTGRGMGFRDSCQDLLGFVHLIPARARERILDIAAVQFADGSTHHQYQPLTKRGNGDIGGGFNDDPLWLVSCADAYIRETGDAAILEEPVPFDNVPGSEQPLFEHLRRSIGFTLAHLGPHGLPLIGRADWNDCLNLNCFSEEPGESFQTCSSTEGGVAESVFIAGMFVEYGRAYAALCERYGDAAEGEAVRKAVADMEGAVLKHGWDGAWYLRAYDAFGNKVGSNDCAEGKIFVEPQGFCALAGIGRDAGLCERALDSVDKHLLNDYGVELLWPCYTAYRKELGEITSYPPGYKENGSVFSHSNPWVSIAQALLGRGDRAFDLYRRICPAYGEEWSDIRATEPYVYSQTIAGRAAKRYGQAKNSWLTGTAAWAFVNITQYILGIRPDYDGLTVRPVLPEALDGFRAERWFRGTRYDIRVRRGNAPGMKVDGVPVDGDRIPAQPEGTRVSVEVVV